MAGGQFDSSLTRVQPFFGALIKQDPTGKSWLPALLSGAPHGQQLLDRLDGDPGTLFSAITSAPDGKKRLGCFEYAVNAPRDLLGWFIDHPTKLSWPPKATFSAETTTKRRALLYDEAPGRSAAQAEARAALAAGKSPRNKWWCFEGSSMLDCVLLTDRLVVTVEGKRTEGLSAATAWYPKRSQLVRNLEAAKTLAGHRAWGSLLLSEQPVPEGTDRGLDAVLSRSAPHLGAAAQGELAAAYLGNTTWVDACLATGLDFDGLPKTTLDL